MLNDLNAKHNRKKGETPRQIPVAATAPDS